MMLTLRVGLAAALVALFAFGATSELTATTAKTLSEWTRQRDAAGWLVWLAAVVVVAALTPLLRRFSTTVQIAVGVLVLLATAGVAVWRMEMPAFGLPTEALGWELFGVAALGAAAAFAPWRWWRSASWQFAMVFGLAFAAAALVGWPIKDLPSGFHDEYAYLFQTQMFLDGRTAYPAEELQAAFRQVHVLDRGVWACRYFPGTALWLMPFVAAGVPWAALWTTHALTAAFSALALRRVSVPAAWVTGTILAVAPGKLAFANTVLSVSPTMAAFAAFCWLWPTVSEGRGKFGPFVAGLAMAAAFLTRPLTAVGLGLPFAIVALVQLLVNGQPGYRGRFAQLVVGFAVGPLGLAAFNLSVLGTMWESPYSRYIDTITPSHVYGFENRTRGLKKTGPDVFAAYDDWATNHTLGDAPALMRRRLAACLTDGLAGLFAIGFWLLVAVLWFPIGDKEQQLWIVAAFGLLLIYAPYWFEGLFGYGYFAEAMPLLVMLAVSTADRLRRWLTERSCAGLGVLALTGPLVAALWTAPATVPIQFARGSDFIYPRVDAQRYRDAESAAVKAERRPILVLVAADPKNAVHSTLVFNDPKLDGPVVRAWHDPQTVEKLRRRFPDRPVYLMEHQGFAKPFGFRRLGGPME